MALTRLYYVVGGGNFIFFFLFPLFHSILKTYHGVIVLFFSFIMRMLYDHYYAPFTKYESICVCCAVLLNYY